MERFKIFALQETWITENFYFNFHFPNYVTYLCFARKSLLGDRASGGVAVFVENNVNSYIKRICSDFEYGILLVIDKSLLELDRECLYMSIYLPPEGSPFYRDDDGSGFDIIVRVFNELSLTDFYIILNGDLNARTGNHDDTFGSSNTMPHLREFEDFLESEVDTVRVNSDDKVNKFGRQLINFCKSYGCLIANGRFGNDVNKGDYTFINRNGCNTIDYFVISENIAKCITDFEILSSPDSAHMPVFIEFCITILSKPPGKVLKNYEDVTNYNIDVTNSASYLKNLSDEIDAIRLTNLKRVLGILKLI